MDKYELKPWIEETLADKKFKTLTDIQKRTLPLLLNNRNVIGVSTTGSGKTHAFLIPTLNKLKLDNILQVLIIAPTRELARQIYSMLIEFKIRQPLLNAQLLIGGADYDKQIEKIQKTTPQIIVVTVDKLLLSIQTKAFDTKHLTTVILDEADMLMDLGFGKQLVQIFDAIDNPKLQKMGWSATLHEMLSNQLARFFKNTEIVTIGNSIYQNDNIKHHIIHTTDKLQTLDVFMKTISPYLCLIFCNSKKSIDKLLKYLKEKDCNVIGLHADLASRERRTVYQDIKNLKYQYVVASDLASRGLDIDGASHIINWDLPENLEWYVHRAGRSGRGRYTGDCYVLFDGTQEKELLSLERKGIKFNHQYIKDDQFVNKVYQLKGRTLKLDDKTNAAIKVVANRTMKVKPGYKKKQQKEITKLKQKSKRKYLESKIKQDRIKKYKQRNAQ